jgi:nitrilase
MSLKVSVGQVGSVMFDTPATMQRVEAMCRAAAAEGSRLLVLPEALVGGYPKGMTFGAVVGHRSDAGRDQFVRYTGAAIRCPGLETEMLAAWARELDLHVVVGVIERDGGTLYCTSLLFTPDRGLTIKHRKLMPTAMERLIWGFGDASTMQVTETEIGRIGMAICWENYMPMYRQHLYNQQVEIWCAPTVDDREVWQASMRHIAVEGRCFVLSACQLLTRADWPEDMKKTGGEINGSGLIASPFGQIIGGSMRGEGLLTAELDMDEIVRGKFDLDVAGHYSRGDIFKLTVNE